MSRVRGGRTKLTSVCTIRLLIEVFVSALVYMPGFSHGDFKLSGIDLQGALQLQLHRADFTCEN